MFIRDIIKVPAITEKNNRLRTNAKKNCFVFEVDVRANKAQIKQAVAARWKVKVLKVNTSQMPGKWKKQGRTQGRRPDWKKAFVRLAPGEKIGIFEG